MIREFIGSMGSDAVLQRELRNNNKWTKERKYGKKFFFKKRKTKDGEGRNKRSEKRHWRPMRVRETARSGLGTNKRTLTYPKLNSSYVQSVPYVLCTVLLFKRPRQSIPRGTARTYLGNNSLVSLLRSRRETWAIDNSVLARSSKVGSRPYVRPYVWKQKG